MKYDRSENSRLQTTYYAAFARRLFLSLVVSRKRDVKA